MGRGKERVREKKVKKKEEKSENAAQYRSVPTYSEHSFR